ncbi:TetR/AcrR family transcriptional regulator [Streptomyces sp. NPDC006553]|uniref:TetR/AcrR family transcriptional regulator n=1 Tax=Streptomyces sp. NPDC006553 TaxID=3157180 RepID=UPI0033B0F7F1
MTRFRESVRTLLREQVLDAAYRLVAAGGWGGLRMTSLARAAGVGRTLQQAVGNPLVKGVLLADRGGEDDLLAYLATRPEPVFGTAMAMLAAYAVEAWPDVGEESRGLAVETIVRLTAGPIVQPVASPEGSARRIAAITARIAYPGGRA